MCWIFQKNVKAWRPSRKLYFPSTLDTQFFHCYLLFLSWLVTEGMNFIPHFNTSISVKDFIGWIGRFWTSQRLYRQGYRAAKNCKDIDLLVWPYWEYLRMNFGYLCRSDLKYQLYFSARHSPAAEAAEKVIYPSFIHGGHSLVYSLKVQ